MASLVLIVTSCKKDDPAPKQVVKSEVTLENFDKNADNNKSITWYSSTAGVSYTMEQIKANLPISEKIDFGLNINDVEFGIYSPSTYPQPYGQNTWTKLNSTIFKTPADLQGDLKNKIINQPEAITVDFINKNFNDGFVPSSQATGISTDQVIAFKAANGNTGLIFIKNFNFAAKTALITVFVAK
ncbi:MAG: hypothetical protein IPJ81_17205 [Chitinophagaceae bacterium]|nr:hypothetical protein [Chitinophagaceae bacterium]